MPIEIERKFLVNQEKWKNVSKGEGLFYEQGYILREAEKTIRVRMAGEKGFLTIKGKTSGLSRAEYEYEIPLSEAQDLLENFCPSRLQKKRYKIKYKNNLWEVDEFLGDNEGLIIAEIELKSEGEHFEKPEWLADEVTGEKKYYNSELSIHPYKNWNHE